MLEKASLSIGCPISDMSRVLKSQGKFSAAGLLVGERLIRLFVGFFIHAWMARTLSPEQFGFISFVAKSVAVYYTFGLFGSDEIVIKELISSDRNGQKNILTTVCLLRLTIGLFGWGLMLLISGLASGFGGETWTWMLIFGVTIPLQALTVFELPFISKMAMTPIFFARNGSYFVGVAGKALALLRGWSKGLFLFVYFIEELSWKLFVSLLAWKNGWGFGRFSKQVLDLLWKPSVLTFLSAFIMLFDQRLPFLFVEGAGNELMLGQYSVIASLMDIGLLVPVSLATALYPSVAEGMNQGSESYVRSRQEMANWLTWAGLAFSFSVFVLSPYIIRALYGGKYTEIEPILKLMAFTAIFGFFNIARFRWFALEHALGDWIRLILLGLFLQGISLTVLLPKFGLQGVVFSALIGQILPNLILIGNQKIQESMVVFARSLRLKH